MRRMSGASKSSTSKNALISICGVAKKKNIAIKAASVESPIVTAAVRFTAAQSPRANACPARTVPACDSPKCTIKLIAANCSTIPCAANSKCPNQPIIKAEPANKPLSAKAVAEIGMARRVTANVATRSNRQNRANIACSGKQV